MLTFFVVCLLCVAATLGCLIGLGCISLVVNVLTGYDMIFNVWDTK